MKTVIPCCLLLVAPLLAEDWLQFRGPNGGGVSPEAEVPVDLSVDQNPVWKTPVPPGHSSPVVAGDRIFLTAVEGESLLVLALDRATGELLWRRESPRARTGKTHKMNNSASATPVSDGRNVYAFFGDFGLLAYNAEGDELWRLPLGPFKTGMGMSSSPILANGKLVLVCDTDNGSYIVAVDPRNGELLWKTDRSEYTRSFSTPALYRPSDGSVEIVVPGAFELAGYSLDEGEKLWWARGLCWQPKTTAAVSGDSAYVHCWAGGGDSPLASREQYPDFDEVLASHDANKDGKITQDEAFLEKMAKNIKPFDVDKTGALERRDWEYFLSKNQSTNALMAVKLGGRGDVTESHVRWIDRKSLPNVASPLVYDGIVYTAKNGGIVSAIDAETGEPLKRGRLSGAMGQYMSSPVAADGRVYFLDLDGILTVVRAGSDWEVLSTVPLEGGGNATPAIADGRLYVRTHENLYCFGR